MVSIIIPCYNQGAFIEETIDSVKAQTYTDWEIIIVDDGSSDMHTIKILKELSNQGYTIITTKNNGVSAARNIGVSKAIGTYLLPLDADDKIAPAYLTDAVSLLENDKTLKLVYSDCEYFGEKIGLSLVPTFSMEGMLLENLIFNAAVIRKIDFENAGGYDEDFKLGWEDWEFWIRLIKNESEVFKIPKVYFHYRIKSDSRNSTIQEDKRKSCEQQLYKKHINIFLKKNENPITVLNDYLFYKSEYRKLEMYREELHQSISYKIGHYLLLPLKILKRLFKNEF